MCLCALWVFLDCFKEMESFRSVNRRFRVGSAGLAGTGLEGMGFTSVGLAVTGMGAGLLGTDLAGTGMGAVIISLGFVFSGTAWRFMGTIVAPTTFRVIAGFPTWD